MGLGRHVDDGALFGVGLRHQVRTVLGVDPAGDDAADRHGLPAAVGLERRAVCQVGVEVELEVRAERGELGAQRRDLVGRLGAQFGREFTPQV